ncbi:unnamed protein product [Closterium sp. Yama58-4]|nr:unnamed protein product [Closterium sp. Yama58-4]
MQGGWTMAGRHHGWAASWLGGIMAGRHHDWAASWLGGIMAGRHHGWAASWLGGIMAGRHHGWAASWLGLSLRSCFDLDGFLSLPFPYPSHPRFPPIPLSLHSPAPPISLPLPFPCRSHPLVPPIPLSVPSPCLYHPLIRPIPLPLRSPCPSCPFTCPTRGPWQVWMVGGVHRVGIYVLRDLRAGDEVLYDYCLGGDGGSSSSGRRLPEFEVKEPPKDETGCRQTRKGALK